MGAATRTGSPTGAVYPARVSLTPSAILSLLIFVTTVAPFIMLILAALTRSVGLPPSPQNLTLAHFSEALHSRYLGALGRSLVLSFTAASIVVALGSLVASLRRHWAGRPFRTAVLLTFAVPGSTLAVAMLLAYGGRLRDTLALILLAYLAKLWGVGHRIVEGAAGSVPPDLFRAARASGASGLTAVATVVARLLRPALVGGWLMVFIIAFHELTMSSLLYGPGTDTVAVVVLNLQQVGNVGVTSAVAVLLTLPALLLALPALAFARTSRTVLGGGE
jgi:iron(III) transport system permease protein